MVKKIYVAPSVEEVSVLDEGVLCQSQTESVTYGNFSFNEAEDYSWE